MYHKAGNISKALTISFASKNYTLLNELISDLEPATPVKLIQKCVSYFLTNERYENCVLLYLKTGRIKDALKVAVEHNVIMIDSLFSMCVTDDKDLNAVIAELCMSQKKYANASKKYVQIGDREMALKALMCLGDIEKVIFFTSKFILY